MQVNNLKHVNIKEWKEKIFEPASENRYYMMSFYDPKKFSHEDGGFFDFFAFDFTFVYNRVPNPEDMSTDIIDDHTAIWNAYYKSSWIEEGKTKHGFSVVIPPNSIASIAGFVLTPNEMKSPKKVEAYMNFQKTVIYRAVCRHMDPSRVSFIKNDILIDHKKFCGIDAYCENDRTFQQFMLTTDFKGNLGEMSRFLTPEQMERFNSVEDHGITGVIDEVPGLTVDQILTDLEEEALKLKAEIATME